jgi:MerR family transcriptional regulator/heat shock protein HspR
MATLFPEARGAAPDEPMYVISVAARLVEMHPQTLRYYERAGLVKPTRSRGRIRLYSQRDIDRLRKIARLVDDLGVNLAGVEVILNLTEKLQVMQQILDQYQIPHPEAEVSVVNQTMALMVQPPPEEIEAVPAPVRIQVRRPPTARRERKESTNGN